MALATQVSHPPTCTAIPTQALHLWHLLSLDAPTVATLWTWFVARSIPVPIPLSGLLSMFLAVWMLYAADRLLDARQLFSNPLHTADLEARHLFHHRHATSFLTAILVSSLVLAILLPHLLSKALRLYTILATLLFGWFLLIHTQAASHRRLPKEIAVGIFFPAATFIPTIARRPDLRLALLPYALLFAAVCSLNCLSIYAWEHPAPHTTAHWTTRLSTRHLTALSSTITFTGLALTIYSLACHTHLYPLSLAATLSALILLSLHRKHNRISPLTLRTTADLALLTPLLLPFFK
jgi:hypothetical protein